MLCLISVSPDRGTAGTSNPNTAETKALLPGLLKAHFLTPAAAEVMARAGQLANELGAINGGEKNDLQTAIFQLFENALKSTGSYLPF